MEKLLNTKKITRASLKAFIKRNKGNLYVNHKSTFDGMVDGCVGLNKRWQKAKSTDKNLEHSLGVEGLWLVGSSRDYFTLHNQDGFVGIAISNSCGYSIVGVKI